MEVEHGFNTKSVGIDDPKETKVDGGGGKFLGILGIRECVQVAIGIDDGDLSHKIWQSASMCCCTMLFEPNEHKKGSRKKSEKEYGQWYISVPVLVHWFS